METLEKSTYEGYLWYSNAKEPQLFFGEENEFSFDDNKNPFVIEGWLTDGKTSYQIKYIDGKHLVRQYNLEMLKASGLKTTPKSYYPSFKGVSRLEFIQYWRPETDELCEKMQVLKPAEFIFIGFTK